ncbi:MAG: phosphonate metabolism protein/1,5-bisphosphokinase (PRPP-forming) PhnN [Alphaproteobacteria bacterium]
MDRLGPGTLVLVVGPSGAGKDTVIAGARSSVAGDERYVFPRRVVTRPASAAEDNIEVTPAMFASLAEKGAFALSWAAHDHHYGIPSAIDHVLAEGRVVVCNVSRAVIPAVRERYEDVRVVLITAPPEVLAARVAARGRSTDGAVEARVARAIDAPLHADLTVVNDGSVETAVDQFRVLLKSLAPDKSDRPMPPPQPVRAR